MKITPMLEQYLRLKQEHPDALLFFHLGDFYELFFEDAERAAPLLDITLTTRSRKDEVPIPMCGVPHHAVQPYVAKLLAAGLKVALCEQAEDPATARGLVARALVRVITPGTVTEEEYLDPKQPNYLVALHADGAGTAAAYTDLSTGELRAAAAHGPGELAELLGRLAPREVLVAADLPDLRAAVEQALPGIVVSTVSPERFDASAGAAWWRERAGALPPPPAGLAAALAALAWYLGQTHRASLAHLRMLPPEEATATVQLDEATRRNLELLATVRGERRGSLLWVLDETQTPMGGRLLRQWLLAPLTDVDAIGQRLDAVEELRGEPRRRAALRTILGTIGDLERLTARLTAGRVNPRDLVALAAALAAVERLAAELAGTTAAALTACRSDLDPLPALQARIGATLSDDPPLNPRAGGVIRAGYDAHVDELRELARSGKRYIGELEAAERARTGIASLKVRFNQVFGYYIEVTKPNLPLVPPEYRRKQTVANAERFVTPALEAYEAKVLGAEERLLAREAELFAALVAEAAAHRVLAGTARALARLDVFAALAQVAERSQYVRPRLSRARRLVITDGRHPVVERMCGRAGFVPNSSRLDPADEQILILTGPNMAGKSTYLRQVALITLLAQIGSFVSAADAEIGVVDRIFTRIGASDNLAAGESTFMVEMKETAQIISRLTDRSLVVLDEIGRGTSTFDGISIAWAVAEYLHDGTERRPLVLFATHYHELTDLARTKERVRNYSVAVREWKGEVLFLRRIVPGPASQSYGIQVAQLAGLPTAVIGRAKEILGNLERGELTEAGLPRLAVPPGGPAGAQLALFGGVPERLRSELAALEVDRLTPLEALNRLHALVALARREG